MMENHEYYLEQLPNWEGATARTKTRENREDPNGKNVGSTIN